MNGELLALALVIGTALMVAVLAASVLVWAACAVGKRADRRAEEPE